MRSGRVPRPRVGGFSLALVLLVSSVVIAVGFAMAALSSFSLNLAAQTLSQARSSAVARAVVAQVCYELDLRVWKKNPWDLDTYPDMAYGGDALRQRFRTMPLFPDAEQQVLDSQTRAWVDFDGNTYRSTDNLTFEEPRPGWTDEGTSGASVPPFCLSLIVTTGTGDSDDRSRLQNLRHYESVILRAWPYAAYSLDCPIEVHGGAFVRGNLYDALSLVTIGGSDEPSAVQGDICVQGTPDEALIRIASNSTVAGAARYHVYPPFGGAAGGSDSKTAAGRDGQGAVGVENIEIPIPKGAVGDKINPFSSTPFSDGVQPETIKLPNAVGVRAFYNLLANRWPNHVRLPVGLFEQTNDLLDKVTIWHGRPLEKLQDLNAFRGLLEFRLPLPAPPEEEDEGKRKGGKSDGFGIEDSNGNLDAKLLTQSLDLKDGVYAIPHSLTNHFGLMIPNRDESNDLWTGSSDGPATITLNDAVLIVRGDLDVRGLRGDNSALYVTGNLFLTGGALEAGDKGMLVMADNILVETSGDFRGVIAARGAVRFTSGAGRLKVRGAVLAEGSMRNAVLQDASGRSRIMCDSPLELDGTTVIYDRGYTRVLNRLGTTRQVLFREIP